MAVHDPTDPAFMSDDDRLREVSAIFAAGVMRLRRRSALSPNPSPTYPPAESEQNCLDDSRELRLHGPRTVNASREAISGSYR